jgi:hypothetical protein
MRKRFQYGSLFRRGKNWVAQWWEDGHRRKRTLGPISKTEARQELAKILSPINERWNPCSAVATLTDLIGQVYLPLYRRKWKRSTTMANENRIAFHVAAELGARALRSIHREELQAFLDRKAASGLSYSVVAHLRWDLKQILALAVAEGILCRNPAELLFTPRDCPRPATRIMTIEQVRLLLSVLALRERLIARLAIVAGMRPGEIFALKWSRLEAEYADIRQRVYRGDLDSPKSPYSVRWAALSDGLGLPFGKADYAAVEGQLLAPALPAQTQLCGSGMGQLPRHAEDSQLPAQGAGRRSADPGGADGPHSGCQRKRLHEDFARAPPRGGQQARVRPPNHVNGARLEPTGWGTSVSD